MDAFEKIMELLLNREGYWTQTSYKVCLSKEEKRIVGKPSNPRVELDIIAYKPQIDTLLVLECKSFLNSSGTHFTGLIGEAKKNRYKLFNDSKLRKVVFNRLKEQLLETGLCNKKTKIKLCLASAKIYNNDKDKIEKWLKKNNFGFFSPQWIANQVSILAESDYENDIAIITTKLLKNTRTLI